MPLPFLAAIPALIAAASTTTLVVGGAVAAVAVVATIGAFLNAVKKLIRKYGGKKAVVNKIKRNLNNKAYNDVDIGIYDDYDNYLGIAEIQVSRDVDVRRGEVIYS
ncbi:hypothetical protein XJ32_11010 [Helicobacter bilis]|uniref:Uncharacterized protein n=2 Tax=Helicobacter bilis TaxID=37372 RepID=C3XI41_9HELI|nr:MULTISPECIES: hypothetical protein [Helicobacter]AQQ60518.1 hypothetical protein XJ32_11010 [Helicobacter bilis]EEO24680.2 hypothetical protein HRAG_01737 [Helicobacter bilis ATCC 43879]